MQQAETMTQNEPPVTRIAKLVDEHVGERIRHLRTTLGLTQEQLASALGISYQQIQKYETGANRVSAGRLYEIAIQLDVEPAFFFADVDTKKPHVPMPHGGKNRTTIELVTNFSEIKNSAVRSSLASLVRTLANKPDADPEAV